MSIFNHTSCKFCHKSISLKSIYDSSTDTYRADLEDQSLQTSLHFIESPGCEVLHNVMDRGG